MKKIIILVISLLTIFTLTGCTKDYGEKSTYEITNDKITMEVKESLITNKSLTVIITNQTAEEYSFGEPYHLEVKHKNKWYILEPIDNLYFNMALYILNPNESIEKEYNIEYGYETLEKGTYRLVKNFTNAQEPVWSAAEFTIK